MIFADRVRETTTTTGTGTYSLGGAWDGTFVGAVAAGIAGQTVYYFVDDFDAAGTDWEVGKGVVTDASPDTLTRATILASSNSGSAVNWGAGTKSVRFHVAAEWYNSPPLPRGYIDGLVTSNAADADHDITIAVGEARDSTDAQDLVLAAAITKQIDASWSVGTNAGGLDTGSVANSTWYHVWLIKRSDTGVVDALFSTSATAPTMPANYDYKRRIGSVLTNGSANIIAFKQTGNLFYWTEPVLDVSVTTSPTSFTLATMTVPLGIVTEAVVRLDCADTTTSLATVWHGNQTTPAAISSGLGFPRNPSASSVTQGQTVWVFTNTSSQIYYAASNSTGDVNIRAMGWRDTRGRNA